MQDFSEDEIRALQRLKLVEELKHDLVAWARARFWAFAVIGVVLAAVGPAALVNSIIGSRLDSRVEAAIQATLEAAETTEDANEALARANEAVAAAEAASARVSEAVEKRAADLESRLDGVDRQLVAARKNVTEFASLGRTELEAQIRNVEQFVRDLAAKAVPEGTTAAEAFAEDQSRLREAASQQATRFESNSEYFVEIIGSPATEPLVEAARLRLAKLGFVTATYTYHTNSGNLASLRNYYQVERAKDAKGIVRPKAAAPQALVVRQELESLDEIGELPILEGRVNEGDSTFNREFSSDRQILVYLLPQV